VVGAISLEASVLFGHRLDPYLGANIASILPLVLTGPLLVVNLYFYPGGSAERGFADRDRFLRWVARKHDIQVPSLVADRRIEAEQEAAADVVIQAEAHVEEVGSLAATDAATVTCPVCQQVLPLGDAAGHEHFQPEGAGR
jgi:hypothetical protein